MKLVIATAEGEHAFDELFGNIPDLEIVRVATTAEATPMSSTVDHRTSWFRPRPT